MRAGRRILTTGSATGVTWVKWMSSIIAAAASVEIQILVSYDLYYLKQFSTWLDLIILFRTIRLAQSWRR